MEVIKGTPYPEVIYRSNGGHNVVIKGTPYKGMSSRGHIEVNLPYI